MKAWIDAITTAANAGTLTANALSADVTGRAVMATGFFDEATATAKFAAGAVVGSTLLKAGSVTQAKLTPSILDATTVKVGAAANTLGFIPVMYAITVADGSTVLAGQTLDATYGKTVITDVHVVKTGSTGGTTDAVQLCTDSGGTTAVTDSLALNTVAAGTIVRATSLLNNTFAAGAIFYVKRTHTTSCACTMYIRGYLSA